MKRIVLLAPALFLAVFALIQGCGRIGCPGTPPDCVRHISPVLAGFRVTLRYPDNSLLDVRVNDNGDIFFPRPRAPFCDFNTPQEICCFQVMAVGVRPRFAFSASTTSINLQAPPSSIVIYGQDITADYGMPVVWVWDWNGRLVAGKEASAVASDGTWCQVDNLELTNCYSGTYTIVVSTTINYHTYLELGEVTITGWGRDLIDADGDGWPNDRDCDDSNPYVYPAAYPDCSGYNYDANCNGIADVDEFECNSGGGGGCGVYSQSMPETPIYCY